MDSMKCFECVLKHVATALSYGKEILSGHTMGNELDHRIDFLGELTNIEHHLQLMDQSLYAEISDYRKQIQAKKVLITADDLTFLRELYIKVESLDGEIINNNSADKIYEQLQFDPNIVFYEVNNLNYFDLAYKTIKKHLKDYNKIQVLKTDLDLSAYADVLVLHQNIYEYALSADDFILMYENTCFIKDVSAKKIANSFSMKRAENLPIEYLRKQKIKNSIYSYDYLKPCKIKVDIFNDVLKDYRGEYPITVYSYLGNETTRLNDTQTTVYIDRNICCSTKNQLNHKTFARWNEKGFQSLKTWLKLD